MSINVMLVEDDIDLRKIITYNLSKENINTSCIDDGDDLMYALENFSPDLIILDWMLPNISGIDLLKQIKSSKNTKAIPVIMLTALFEEEKKLKAFQFGADDYVSKPFSVKELIARIKVIIKRYDEKKVSNELIFKDLILKKDSKRVFRGKKEIKLGPIEYKLLEIFLSKPGRVYTRSQLLDLAWGPNIYIEERTVDVHVGRLRKALKKYSKVNPLRTVRGTGYSLNDST